MARKLARIVRATLLTLVAMCLLAVTGIKASMWVARIHIAHLLADFQSIQPMRSNWADAQRLMHRWGRWGHYQGTCTATDCAYTILIVDPIANRFDRLGERPRSWLFNVRAIEFANRLGWRDARFSLRFDVQDGIIVRSRTGLSIGVPPHVWSRDDDYGYALILGTQVRSSLNAPLEYGQHDKRHLYWILGGLGTPPAHPDYKVGRPDGCKICMRADVTYTPQLALSEIRRLTAYNLFCLTRWRSCRMLDDVFSDTEVATLYPRDENATATGPPNPVPIPCTAPARAVARDANVVLLSDVQAMNSSQKLSPATNTPYQEERAHLHVLSILKGHPPFTQQQDITVIPFTHTEAWDDYTSEHFTPGTRVVVILQRYMDTPQPAYQADACAILPATPETLTQVRLGISQDVAVRHGDSYDD